MTRRDVLLLAAGAAVSEPSAATAIEIPVAELNDKIRGGFLGQLLGDLNGLKHEMKYIAEPGSVESYTPELAEGAWTDDDTDFEWVYISEMQKSRRLFIPYPRITELWKKHINRRFWCAHEYVRQLMDLGIEPPLTGNPAVNPWSDFNISGQFVCETFGLAAPGMPQTASKLGLHYTHVSISGEPAQTTQLFATMVASAFFENSINSILDAGVAALAPNSALREIIQDLRAWHRQNPADWRATRALVKNKYSRYGGGMRDRNAFELNTAGVVGALLYGGGDFVRTAMAAFNFGWDADNNAATACTVIGVIKGEAWMKKQGWNVVDRYKNTSRDGMPEDETISGFADRICAVAEVAIQESGGARSSRGGRQVYSIKRQEPANMEPLASPEAEFEKLKKRLRTEIEAGVLRDGDSQRAARGAYLAICLDLAQGIEQKAPAKWSQALALLEGYPKVMQVLFFPQAPAGVKLRDKAMTAGLKAPLQQIRTW